MEFMGMGHGPKAEALTEIGNLAASGPQPTLDPGKLGLRIDPSEARRQGDSGLLRAPSSDSGRFARQRGLFGGAAELQMILTAIAVIVVVVVGATYLLLGRSHAQSEWEIINTLMTGSRDLYNGEPYPSGSMTASLISANYTGGAKVSGGNIINNYGQVISVTGASTNFSVTDPGIMASDCIFVLKQVPNVGTTQVTVNGGAAITTFPIGAATAIGQCSVLSSAGNTIAITAQ